MPTPITRFATRTLLGAVSVAFLSGLPPAQASFVDEFYQSAIQTSVTPAGVYMSSEAGIVTGGRYVMKLPRESFQLYSIDAPRLKAGCGGIDAYLGAFSIPSQEEFMSFLRSIGTALPAMAFQIALNAMAPELNEMLSQYRDMLMEFSNMMSDTCQASEQILDRSGAKAWLETLGHQARNTLRSSGRVEDAAEAERVTKTNGAMAIGAVTDTRNAGGAVTFASEMNLTWSLLKSAKQTRFQTSDRLAILMSLVGTTIYLKTGEGDNTTVKEVPLAPLPLLDDWVGSARSTNTVNLSVYRCDTDERCLHPTLTTQTDRNLAATIYEAMKHYQRSLKERNPALVTDEELQTLADISTLPLLNFVEVASSPLAVGYSESFMETYAEAAAYEALLTATHALMDELHQIIGGSGKTLTAVQIEYAKTLENRVATLTDALAQKEQLLANKLSQVADFIREVEHLRRVVYGEATENTRQMSERGRP